MVINSSKIRSFLHKIAMVGTASVLLSAVMSEVALAQTKVVGYIPAGKGLRAVVDRTDLSKVTHLNLSFANPNAAGVLLNGRNPVCMDGATGADIDYVVQKAHAQNVKVLVSVAGGVVPTAQCGTNWENLLTPAMRGTIVTNLLQFANTFNLDGVDIDIEGGILDHVDGTEEDGGNVPDNYTAFIQALRNGLPAGKLLTSATASYRGGMVPRKSLPYFDFVNIMSYDTVGPWSGNTGQEHSTYQKAESDIALWESRGLSKEKLVLGVPFYGYGFGGYAEAYAFSEIVGLSTSAAQNDVIGNACAGCSYITYNGIPTIRNKTRLAMQKGAGIMIWELAHDGVGAYSLLNVINTEIKGGATSSSSSSRVSSSSSSTTVGGSCSAWVEGRQYNVGDKVAYQGGYYIAEYANPGYIPTVSTYFWEPISASQCGGVTSSSKPSSSSIKSSSSSIVSSSSSSVVSACPAWVAGTQYNAGAKVSYLGGYYIAEYANPGYTPTISTYFWEPISASQCGTTSSSSSSSVGAFTRTIQAEAYSVMSGVQLETTQDPSGGGQNVGWIDANDWMTYSNVNFPSSGTYRVEYRVASLGGGGVLDLNLNAGTISLGQLAIPNTGSWQVWTTISHNVTVTAGTYNLGVFAAQGGWNVNWIKITKL